MNTPHRNWLITDYNTDGKSDFVPLLQSFGAPENYKKAISNFLSTIDKTSSETLDGFALKHPQFAKHCRPMMAQILFQNLYSNSGGDRYSRKTIGRYSKDSERNWIDACIEAIANRCRHGDTRKWSIISFNYESIFMRRLEEQWRLFGADTPKFQTHFEFIYPHGKFDDVAETENAGTLIQSFSDSIRFAHQTELLTQDTEDTAQASLAYARVIKANEVFIFGFAAAESNMSTIGLNKPMLIEQSPTVTAQNYDGNTSVQTRLETIKSSNVKIMQGGCRQLILDGMMGELPA